MTSCSARVFKQVEETENYLTSEAFYEEYYHGLFRTWMLQVSTFCTVNLLLFFFNFNNQGFVSQHEKEYEYMDEEYNRRYPKFKDNFKRVQNHSPKEHSYSRKYLS